MSFTRWEKPVPKVLVWPKFFLKFLFSNWEKETGKKDVMLTKYHEAFLKVSSSRQKVLFFKLHTLV